MSDSRILDVKPKDRGFIFYPKKVSTMTTGCRCVSGVRFGTRHRSKDIPDENLNNLVLVVDMGGDNED